MVDYYISLFEFANQTSSIMLIYSVVHTSITQRVEKRKS